MQPQDRENTMRNIIWDDAPVDVTEEVNFIWSIANKLRGPYQSDKYKNVIIPMTIMNTSISWMAFSAPPWIYCSVA